MKLKTQIKELKLAEVSSQKRDLEKQLQQVNVKLERIKQAKDDEIEVEPIMEQQREEDQSQKIVFENLGKVKNDLIFYDGYEVQRHVPDV